MNKWKTHDIISNCVIIRGGRVDTMYTTDMTAVSQAAVNKAEICNKKTGVFMMRSVMAGFFIVVATLLSNVAAAIMYPVSPEAAKIMGAFLFSLAIVLIVFIGGELFTGNNMTMALGVYNKACSWKAMVKVWVLSYIGNFIGCLLLSFLFVISGADREILINYYQTFIYTKLSISPFQLLLRGILCNFMVCLAVWANTRMKSESGKLIVMFCIIMTFVESGFEHCIANMATFSIGSMILGGLDWMLVAKSMFFVTIGNILGGAVLLALPLKLMSEEK